MQPGTRRHPAGLFLLVLLASCDWFAYWTVRSQLFGLAHALGDPDVVANLLQLLYFGGMASVVLAGLACDLGGARAMAIAGGGFLAAGLAALAFPSTATIHAGVGLVVAGRGLIQAAFAVLVASLYGREDSRRDAGFTLFAVAPSVGGFLGAFPIHFGSAASLAIGAAAAATTVVPLARWLPQPVPESTARRGPTAIAAIVLVAVIAIVLETAPSLLRSPSPPGLPPGAGLPLAQISAAIMIAAILFAPLLAWLWLRLGEREPSSPAKLALAAGVSAIQILVLVALGRGAAGELGPIIAPAVTMVAGAFVAPIALSLVSRLAPPRLLGLSLGLWLAGLTYLELQLTRFVQHEVHQASELQRVAGLVGATLAAGLLALLLPRLRRV